MSDLHELNAPELCGYKWKDGWGKHKCIKVKHETGLCRCDCDATRYRPITDDKKEK